MYLDILHLLLGIVKIWRKKISCWYQSHSY